MSTAETDQAAEAESAELTPVRSPRWARSSSWSATRAAFLDLPDFCIGQHVARLEAEAVITALARRVRRLELAGPTRRHHNNTLRAWESIPLRLTLA